MELEIPNPLYIENPFQGVPENLSPAEYLSRFEWNGNKFTQSKSLADLAGIIQEKLQITDNAVKD